MDIMVNKVIEESNNLINDISYLERNRKEKRFFTRTRKMCFVGIIVFLLNFVKKTLQLELDRYSELVRKDEIPMSKAAFSKARNKISEEAFKELFELSAKIGMESGELNRFKNYRVFAIDGTQIQLENTKKLKVEFSPKVKRENLVRARASILCEVLNGVVIDAKIDSIHTDERSMALEHIRKFEKFSQRNDLIIFDRGYPSHELIQYLDNKKIKYLMRVAKNFNNEIDSSNNKDFYIKIEINKQIHKVRVIKIVLPTGEIEMLITNLLRMSFKHSDFEKLYFLRWPIETKYDTVKNKLMLETFSGRTPLAIKQDFYSTMYLSNIVAFAKMESDKIIASEQAEKDLKYEYETNEKMLIGKLKDQIVLAFIANDPLEREQILKNVIHKAARYRTPIRPGRHFERGNPSHKKVTAKAKNVL